jgi:uncharacterized repeat protein (TIGR01451 family)
MRSMIWLGLALAGGVCAAAEVTVKNDSLVNNSQGTIELGFIGGEKAASWLTSPCDGSIVAAQVLWLSSSSGTGQSVEGSIQIFRSGTFPTPGTLALQIDGPQMTDGVINEFRYLDENNTVPVNVPVTLNETFVLSFTFDHAPGASGASTVIDGDGLHANRNAIYADLGGGNFVWFGNEVFPVNGDWVIRAVVNCATVSTDANVTTSLTSPSTNYTAGAALQYVLTVSNAGPAAASSVNVVDIFPGGYGAVNWTCAATGGAACMSAGSGIITQPVNLPSGGQVTFTIDGIVAAGTTGTLSNSATAIVNAPATDPNSTDNTATLDLEPAVSDVIFANGFDAPAGLAPTRVVRSRTLGAASVRR